MRKLPILLFLSATVTLLSCNPEPKPTYLTYKNIIILSDMSNRILNNNFPLKDHKEIRKLIQYFKDECVKPGQKIGDKSSIYFSTLSEREFLSVDIEKFQNLGDKQQFVNSTGEYQNNGLKEKLLEFENGVNRNYNTLTNPGLDLISILLEKIDNQSIIKKPEVIVDGIDTTFINYENHIYLFTDGYLEYTIKSSNNQFRYGLSEIQNVRNYCVNNNLVLKKALLQNNKLTMPLAKSPTHKSIHLHVLETHERDFDNKTRTYKNETGLRDNEILKEVWQKWALESNFKSFEWKKY